MIKEMKICICTVPIRKKPTPVPPFGSMAIIQSLRSNGRQVQFLNIDLFRPGKEELVRFFDENQFDIVGISAVVSTSYSYTKYLSKIIKTVSPKCIIVIGGNLAASAEILLQKCDVDFCVIGEGELTMQDLVRLVENKEWKYDDVNSIMGICFKNSNGVFHFTGYRKSVSAREIEWPDYSILEMDGSLNYYLQEVPYWIKRYNLEIPNGMVGKKHATIPVAKGCVNSCTFCHRWIKGYRSRPVEQIREHIQYLKDRYDVGFVDLFDEAFGANKRHARELATCLGDMGMIWRAGAVRVTSVDKEILQHWKVNGCRMVNFGLESGSQKILDIMEKNATIQDNVNALRWTKEVGLATVVQLLVGMPGETDDTVQETIEFLKQTLPYYTMTQRIPNRKCERKLNVPRLIQTITYAQALPGTPLYEYARQHGLIGDNLDGEEKYLQRISDVDAVDGRHFLNYSGQPMIKVWMWRYKIGIELDSAYMNSIHNISLSFANAIKLYSCISKSRLLSKRIGLIRQPNREGNYGYLENVSYVKMNPLFLNAFSKQIVYFVLPFVVAKKYARSAADLISLIAKYFWWHLLRSFKKCDNAFPNRSLRRYVTIKLPVDSPQGSEEAIPLRLGR